MTQEHIAAILNTIFSFWQDLKPNEVKSLLRILAARNIVPKCAECGHPLFDPDEITWDHAFPHSKGGPDLIGNLIPMHANCNIKKDDIIDEKYFCYIEPELLQQILKQHKKENKHKRREEIRKNAALTNCNSVRQAHAKAKTYRCK
jgi:hypothetical protein